MTLKNAYSKINIQHLFNGLQKTLSSHGAKQIVFEYAEDGSGMIIGLTFIIKYKDRYLPIKLPARIENVAKVLENQGFTYSKEQVYRVAWRNINDWVEAQMALLECEMVRMEEIFLPYMTDQTGITYFERIERNQFLLKS